jgi:hypothetical protein
VEHMDGRLEIIHWGAGESVKVREIQAVEALA